MTPPKKSDSTMSDRPGVEPPVEPPMMSDGKRDRVIWRPSDGNGDSDRNLFDRSFVTKAGHPTWKLFTGDVADVIVLGENEPPHYVYLDDKAAHAVLNSKAYTKRERHQYWGFDFNRHGMIRTGRPNRGRPVYRDEHQLLFATAPQLGGVSTYLFSGEPPAADPKQPSRSGAAKNAATKKGHGAFGDFRYRSIMSSSLARPVKPDSESTAKKHYGSFGGFKYRSTMPESPATSADPDSGADGQPTLVTFSSFKYLNTVSGSRAASAKSDFETASQGQVSEAESDSLFVSPWKVPPKDTSTATSSAPFTQAKASPCTLQASVTAIRSTHYHPPASILSTPLFRDALKRSLEQAKFNQATPDIGNARKRSKTKRSMRLPIREKAPARTPDRTDLAKNGSSVGIEALVDSGCSASAISSAPHEPS